MSPFDNSFSWLVLCLWNDENPPRQTRENNIGQARSLNRREIRQRFKIFSFLRGKYGKRTFVAIATQLISGMKFTETELT